MTSRPAPHERDRGTRSLAETVDMVVTGVDQTDLLALLGRRAPA